MPFLGVSGHDRSTLRSPAAFLAKGFKPEFQREIVSLERIDDVRAHLLVVTALEHTGVQVHRADQALRILEIDFESPWSGPPAARTSSRYLDEPGAPAANVAWTLPVS
jgi:hypothetical protein